MSGRVSKRYSTKINEKGYWLKGSTFLLDAKEKNNICLNKIFNNYSQLSNIDGVKVYQPNSFELEERPKDIRDSSNSQWIWENHFLSKAVVEH